MIERVFQVISKNNLDDREGAWAIKILGLNIILTNFFYFMARLYPFCYLANLSQDRYIKPMYRQLDYTFYTIDFILNLFFSRSFFFSPWLFPG